MPSSPSHRPNRVILFIACAAFAVSGCTRDKYRLQADQDAYEVIAERNIDPRWCAPDYGIDMDPRSRYFDPYDPDHSPMPQDDPVSHAYMHRVDGKKGWKHWHDNGERMELENPAWQEALAEYVETTEDGAVKLNVDSAIQLAYIHAPSNQIQLETLYLSSLDVTAERFRLATQFFGGYDARYAHNGSLIPPALRFDPLTGRFIVNPPIDGVERNILEVGRPLGASPALEARRRFATAGELLVGFANSFLFEFTGGDANLSTSLANFAFIQPLLRGAGKDVALEALTLEERNLLANLRAYSQFRQGFYTQVAIGELGVVGPQRGGRGTALQVFSGQSNLGGYVGLLQQLQEIRNTEDNLSLQERTLEQLEAHLAGGVIDLVQVDQFRQSIESERSSLLLRQNAFDLSLDTFKTRTLGLPPDLAVDLDDTLIRQFQLVARQATGVQDSISEQRDVVLADDADLETIRQALTDAASLVEPVRNLLAEVRVDLAGMGAALPTREQTMSEEGRDVFQREREQLLEGFVDLVAEFEEVQETLTTVRAELSEENMEQMANERVVWLGDLYRIVQGSILVQARARLESVSVSTIELDSRDAFEIALMNRLDFMNARAALVDSWRAIQFNADALQSVVNITASGDIRTARNNPVSFRAPTANFRAGLEFDAPFTRLLERNAYRESLINYQRSRRAFIQSRDSLHLDLRVLLRQVEQLRMNLEIQRRAVAIAIRRVDLTRAAFYAPVPPPRPGQPPAQFGPTAARNSLEALAALRNSQNAFLGVWLNYYAAQMRLARELGIMVIDQDGQWIRHPLPGSAQDGGVEEVDPSGEELPVPVIPVEWIKLVDYLPQDGSPLPVVVDQPEVSSGEPPFKSSNRLLPTGVGLQADTNRY